MNRRLHLLSIVALTGAVLGMAAIAIGQDERPGKAQGLRNGQKAPDFTLIDASGQERSLATYQGKLVVLEWINPECPYVVNCYKSKAMTGAYKKIKELDKSAVWLAINSTRNTTPEQNAFWIKQHKLGYPILLDNDGTVGRLYGARRTPHMFVIDPQGVLRYHGAIDDNPFARKSADEVTSYVVEAATRIVANETVSPDYVKPYGCTVKYKR